MTSAAPQFSLLSGDWIPTRAADGTTSDRSLRDVLHNAREIREITGELPTQSFAITRLLLAILYRTLDGAPLTLTTWQRWYTEGLPLDDVDDYLDEFADRFELFHPERPFFQVADLATASGERKDVTPIIFDLPSNNRLFTNRSGSGAADLSFAEAARWLVNAQAFDASGIKSGAIGDDRVKGGKGYPIGLAWSGLLGGVLAQGASLHETLMLNLVGPGEGFEPDGLRDIPPWEETDPDTSATRENLGPVGPVRLYTWQSRRIRLFSESDRVVGCLVANGDKLTPQNLFRIEPMTAWRFSEPQTKAAKQTTYMPREHLPARAPWRGIGALLPGIAPIVPKRDVPSSHAPGVVNWLARLDSEGLIPPSSTICLRTIGVVYGSNNSVVDEVIDDDVLLPLALLRERNRALAAQAEYAVRLADEGVLALRRLAENLERAAGGPGEGARSRAGDEAYAALDAPCRAWLRGLAEDADPLAAIDEWKRIARAVLRSLGAELIARSSPTAWVGREVSRLGQVELITTPRAESWYLRSLTKTFGAFSPVTTQSGEDAVA